MKKIRVDDIDGEERLDTYLNKRLTELSRNEIKEMIDTELILVNDKKEKPSYKVRVNDNILINEKEKLDDTIKPENIPLEIVYEDDDIVIINKSKNLIVHPAGNIVSGTLVNALLYKYKDNLSGVNGELRPGVVHRLDKDTSGLIIIAKNDETHLALIDQFKNRTVEKKYVALVRGDIKEEEATIKMPILRNKKDRQKMTVDIDGKEAITHFKVIKNYDGYTLIDIDLETGRTHQIRVHMSEIGHPIVGDQVYSNGKNNFDEKSQILHAYALKFVHPKTKKVVEISIDKPEYFKKIIKLLEKGN